MAKKTKDDGDLPVSDELLSRLLSRGEFNFGVNGGELYRRYRDGYLEGGKLAMKDAMGQAASLTGGYGNSYAASAGQQAYSAYAAKAADKLPELYELALQRYDRERAAEESAYKLLRQRELDDRSAALEERELAVRAASQKLAEEKEKNDAEYRMGTLRAKERKDYFDYLLGYQKTKAAGDPLGSLDYGSLGVAGADDLDSLRAALKKEARGAGSADGANARIAGWLESRRLSGALTGEQADLLWFFLRFYESDFSGKSR